MPLTPGTCLGSFEIRALLGSGGMGEVYRAHDPGLGREVALKVLPADLCGDRDRVRRFRVEALALGALSHPRVVQVHDAGEADGFLYLVMECLEGETLRSRLARGPMPWRRSVEILAAVARLKACNPGALYFCDPVMGHPDKGCIVAPGVTDFFRERALPRADLLAPNLLELEQLTGRDIGNVSQALAACQQLREQGVKMVLVKHLGKAGFAMDRFEMLLVCEEGAFHLSRPLYPFARHPIGVGDLLSATMLANLLAGFTPVAAFERTNASVDAVLAQTWLAGAYELQLVAAQQAMVEPEIRTCARRLPA